MRHSVLLMRHQRYWLVGPFDSPEHAAEWGRRTQTAVNDDPRWQTIELDVSTMMHEQPGVPAHSMCSVYAPDHLLAAENGQPD